MAPDRDRRSEPRAAPEHTQPSMGHVPRGELPGGAGAAFPGSTEDTHVADTVQRPRLQAADRESAGPASGERPAASSRRAPGPGSTVADRYLLERVLREGGMGTLHRAHDLRLDIPVAVKFVKGDPAGGRAAERLLKEARAAAQVSHPSAVRVIDVGLHEGAHPFLVMELVRGITLAEALEAKGQMLPEEAVRLILPVVDAVCAAHAAGVIHRDIKPQNILLRAGSGAPLLVDFGIARLLEEAPTSRLTLTGALIGSPEYMAPEQAMGEADVDALADVWALCVVLFELVTGTTPFRRKTPIATLGAVRSEEPTRAGALTREAELWDILRWGMAKERSERWSSAQELGGLLASWAMARGIEADAAGTSLSTRWGEVLGIPPVSPRAEEASPSRRPAGEAPLLLIADDDDAHRTIVRRALAQEGYVVIEASDGDEVLKILAAAPRAPDAMLLDFCMPGFSGLGVLRILRRQGGAPATFIMTGFPDSSVDRMARQLGAVRVFHKPLDLDTVSEAIHGALSRPGDAPVP